MDEEKGQRGNVPTPTEMVTFAREYIRSYLDTVNEKAPEHLPPIAQQSPYAIEICLLPNNCYALILETAPEMKIHASFKNWEELQDIVVRSVDFFIGFYPHEMKSVADWKKRGRKDATRDIRVAGESELGRAAGTLSKAIDEIGKMAASNPWLTEKAGEQIQVLRDIEDKLRSGFAPMDAIAALQDLKAYRPAYEKMLIEFPDRSILENILQGIEEVIAIKERMDIVENRMFEVERNSTMKSSSDEEYHELREKSVELEGHLERMSNIIQMLNTKVEKYFSQSAEVDRQATVEVQVKDLTKKVDSLIKVISDLQGRQKEQLDDLTRDILKVEEELEKSQRRIKRMERHFVDVAKSVEE